MSTNAANEKPKSKLPDGRRNPAYTVWYARNVLGVKPHKPRAEGAPPCLVDGKQNPDYSTWRRRNVLGIKPREPRAEGVPPRKIDGKWNPAYQRWYDRKKHPNAGMRQPSKYSIPSRINGKRNPEYTRLYNQSERGLAAAARRREKRIAEGRRPANRGRKCAYCEVHATGVPVKNGDIIHGPRIKGQSGGKSQRGGMFICRECCPDGRLTPCRAQERIRTHTRIVSGELPEEPLTFARSLRAARDVAAEEYREPVALEVLEESLSELDARARLIIRMRADGFSLDDVGTKVGLTRERIRQIQNEASLKLRKILRKRERELDYPTSQQ